jgi:hypothetical protein
MKIPITLTFDNAQAIRNYLESACDWRVKRQIQEWIRNGVDYSNYESTDDDYDGDDGLFFETIDNCHVAAYFIHTIMDLDTSPDAFLSKKGLRMPNEQASRLAGKLMERLEIPYKQNINYDA